MTKQAGGRIVVITGASGGIGLAAAERFLAAGDRVYGLSRRPYDNGRVTHIPCDVSERLDAERAVKQVLDEAGRIDVLVSNAGFGISGAVEFTEPVEARRQFDVNFFGAVNLLHAALPAMRKQGAGCILFVSSVAGSIAIPFQAFYSASKAAINSLCCALANELRPFGVRVAAVLPGDVKTGFTAARRKSAAGAQVYTALTKSVATMEHDEQNGLSPTVIANILYRLSVRKHPKPLTTGGASYRVLMVLNKLLPIRLVNWLVGKLY